MIPAAFITDWGNTVGWPTVEQIEQDLVLSRLIIEIASDDYLGNELMFRGDTSQSWPPAPSAFSERVERCEHRDRGISPVPPATGDLVQRPDFDELGDRGFRSHR